MPKNHLGSRKPLKNAEVEACWEPVGEQAWKIPASPHPTGGEWVDPEYAATKAGWKKGTELRPMS